MPRSLRLLPALLLPLIGACGPAFPTLLVDIAGIPEMTGQLSLTVTHGGRNSTPVTYSRDSNNKFIATTSMLMPPMAPAPSNTQVALDLPEGTSGAVRVSIQALVGMMATMGQPQQPLTATHSGCGSADVPKGGLYNIKVQLIMSTALCP
jgi:hypothetical protein